MPNSKSKAQASSWTIEDAERTYGVSSWGGGYFTIGDNGNVKVLPDHNKPNVKIDFEAIIAEIRQEKIQFPVVIRFHDVLRSQIWPL